MYGSTNIRISQVTTIISTHNGALISVFCLSVKQCRFLWIKYLGRQQFFWINEKPLRHYEWYPKCAGVNKCFSCYKKTMLSFLLNHLYFFFYLIIKFIFMCENAVCCLPLKWNATFCHLFMSIWWRKLNHFYKRTQENIKIKF